MINVKDKLIEKIKQLDEKTAEKLLDEWDDILLQLELESDEDFLSDVEKARKGEELIDHDRLKKELGLSTVIKWSKRAVKSLKSLPKGQQLRVIRAVENLPGGNACR